MKKFLFGKQKNKDLKDERNAKNESNKENQISGNPYIGMNPAKREWNDNFINMKRSIHLWQCAFFAVGVLAAILAIGLAVAASKSRIQPVAVEVCNGVTRGFLAFSPQAPDNKVILNYAVGQFITNARTVVSDSEAEKVILNKVYAFSADNTLSFLHDYYQDNDPFKIAAQNTIHVDVDEPIQLSKNTLQITWTETKNNINGGAIVSKTRWLATVSYKFGEIKSEFLKDNPFGIYITDLSWSQIPTE